MNKRSYISNRSLLRLCVSLCFVGSSIAPISAIATPSQFMGQSKAGKVPLESVLLELQGKFNNTLVYNIEDISNIQVEKVDLNRSLTDILDKLFTNSPFKY